MYRLLERDLRLHGLLLVTPLLLTTALAYYLGKADPGDRALLAGLAAFVAGLLPLSFHLRESSEGTLGALVALPVSRAQIVRLRYLEALLLPVAAILLLCLEGLAFQALQTRAMPSLAGFPEALMGHPVGLAWIFFWCCAYPLPAVLGWGAKGLGVVLAVPGVLLSSLPLLVVGRKDADLALRILGWLAERWHAFTAHCGLELLLAVVLIALSHLLSLKAFAARDL